MSERTPERAAAWRRAADPALLVAAILFLPAYAIPIVWKDSPGWVVLDCEIAMWAIWGLFAIDLAVRCALAPDRLAFLRSSWVDVLIVVLPLLRPLRVLRLLAVARIFDARATARLQGRLVAYVFGGAFLLATLGALAVMEAERESAEATIVSFGDALWWAFTTMSTPATATSTQSRPSAEWSA